MQIQQAVFHIPGHIIKQHRISPDPSNTAAVLEMETSKSLTELRQFMRMVNQLGKFTPNIAELSHAVTMFIVLCLLYRMDLDFRATKLSRFSGIDSHPRKFSPAKIKVHTVCMC